MKQKIEIEIDIPDGWEFVRYGSGTVGEHYWSKGGIFKIIDPLPYDLLFIVREAWQQPDFLKPGWIAMDRHNGWYWFDAEPKINSTFWSTDGPATNMACFQWTPPPCDDWRTSKRRIV